MNSHSRKGRNPNELYDSFFQGNEEHANERVLQAQEIWGIVPPHLKALKKALKHQENHRNSFRMHDRNERVERLHKILREYHKRLGILSEKVKENLNALERGSILTGQQPVIFGGPGLIGNKLGLLTRMHQSMEDENSETNLAPIFFVADYDGLQKELERVYLPNPISEKSVILEVGSALAEPDNVAIHRILSPDVSWLKTQLQEFLNNSHEFISKLKGERRTRYERTLDALETLLRLTYSPSLSLRDWFVKIWAYHTNVIHDYGIIYLPVSHPEVRALVADQYAPFLRHHHEYTEAMENATLRLHDLGYYTTVPVRDSHYSPFFFECGKDGERISLKFDHSRSYDSFIFKGECKICQEHVNLEFHDIEEGLQSIATNISPRVDSSSAVFQELLGVKARISGPGEIAYYGQVAPALRSIGFATPFYIKYKRVFYNSPWIEQLGKALVATKKPSLHQKEFYKLLGKRAKAIQKGLEQELRDAEREIKEVLMGTYQSLLTSQGKQVNLYLGWQYGRFQKEKFGQEVSWAWLDMARITGIRDYLETYRRVYHEYTPFSGMAYINTQ